jgi:hypothetical protein
VGWATLDQAISSCTNFGITVVAARELSRTGFGAFGLAFAVAIVVMGLTRALATEPLLSRPGLAEGPRRQAAWASVAGASLCLGCVAAVGALLAGLMFGEEVGAGLVALALLLPGVCLQDSWRYCFISQGRATAAVVNDSAWLLTQIAVLLALASTGRWSPTSILLTWGGAGWVAGVVGLAQARVLPHPRAGWSWLRDQRDLGGRYCLEFIASTGVTQLAFIGLGAVASLADVGAVRGAFTYYGPLGVLFSSILLAVVPGATRLRTEPAQLRRLASQVSAVVLAAALAWMALALALPERVGRELFGVSWDSTRAVLLPMGLTFVANGLAAGPYVGLRSLAAAREGLHVRLLSLPLVIGGSLAGAAFAGDVGFGYGLAAATAVTTAIYWWQFTLASALAAGGWS